ncbi:hypothetical protein EV643_1433 [Kribbella sp. VKM Ac-2527]|uniref:Methyltransferase family protein n=1 Tax=Kribbella caucasensis TaxID=2512215 RepID=A0A4R6J664_9ACTN|nr:hypothetical protein [Kribbella sp. VKM Ac-2527]TDO29836.1 hypothetical protein EV643_1433 [Kribbella sp. VKM Ac-2527]
MTTAHAAFDSWAPTYELSELQRLLFEPVHRTVLELVHENVPRGARALDVGCGADADVEEDRRSRWPFDRPRGRRMESLLTDCGLDVVDYHLAPVHGPVPSIHVLVARPRPSSGVTA